MANDEMSWNSKFFMSLCGYPPSDQDSVFQKYSGCTNITDFNQGYYIDDGFKTDAPCYGLGMPHGVPHVATNSRNESMITIEFIDGGICKENNQIRYSALVELRSVFNNARSHCTCVCITY